MINVLLLASQVWNNLLCSLLTERCHSYLLLGGKCLQQSNPYQRTITAVQWVSLQAETSDLKRHNGSVTPKDFLVDPMRAAQAFKIILTCEGELWPYGNCPLFFFIKHEVMLLSFFLCIWCSPCQTSSLERGLSQMGGPVPQAEPPLCFCMTSSSSKYREVAWQKMEFCHLL